MRHARLLWLCCALLASQALASAGWPAVADRLFQRIATETGAPNTLGPTAVVEDAAGRLWVGTQNGLVRWDGYDMHRYRAAPAQANALPDAFIQRLHVDRQGALWIGTLSGGLARYRPETDDFEHYPAGTGGLPHPNVTALADAADGGLWVGTDAGLSHFDQKAHRFTQHTLDANPAAPRRVTALLASRGGTLWVGGGDGLWRSTDVRGRFVRAGAERLLVRGLLEDRDGRIWVATRNGTHVLDPATGKTDTVRVAERGAIRRTTEDMGSPAEDVNGEIWLATRSQGVVVVDRQSLIGHRMVRDPRVPYALDSDSIWTIFADRAGLVWVGSDRSLLRHDPRAAAAIASVTGVDGRPRGLATDTADAVLPMPDGRLWVASHRGIEVLAPWLGVVRRLPSAPSGLPEASVYAMVRDADWIYIGTERGLFRVGSDLRRVQRIAVPGRAADAPAWTLSPDGEGRLWVGGPDGLWHLLISPRGLVQLDQPVADLFKDRRIEWVEPTGDGRLWVAARSGLLLLDPVRRSLRPFPQDAAQVPALVGTTVNSLLVDAQQRLWIGTSSAGVVVVDDALGVAPRFHVVGEAEGLHNLDVNRLLADAQGRIWASTDEGLALIDPKQLHARALGLAEGVAVDTYWAHSGARAADGTLFFGGVGGLTVVRPGQWQPWSLRPPTVITALRIDGVKAPELLTEQARRTGRMFLPAEAASLGVEFAALDLSAPERVRYAYRMQGVDRDWVHVDARHRWATYTHLPPGNHLLEVRGTNRDGVETDQTIRLLVEVPEAWHQTSLFRAAMAAMAATALAVLWWLGNLVINRRQRAEHKRLEHAVTERTAELTERTAELEVSRGALRRLGEHNTLALEEERTRIARELHDEMGQQLAALRMEASVLRARSRGERPPTQEQFQLLLDRIEKLTGGVRALVKQLRPPALDGGLAAALEWLAAEFTQATGVPCRLQVDGASDTLPPNVATQVFRLAQESLTNVRRHAHAGQVDLGLQCVDGSWVLTVVDDGTGFDASVEQAGHGLLGMEERARLLGGSIEVDSRIGRGTTVRGHFNVERDGVDG